MTGALNVDEWTHQLTLIGQLRLTGLHVTCVLIGTINVVLTESVCLREKRNDSCVVGAIVNLRTLCDCKDSRIV